MIRFIVALALLVVFDALVGYLIAPHGFLTTFTFLPWCVASGGAVGKWAARRTLG